MTGKYNHQSQCFIYRADLDVSKLRLQAEEVAAAKWYDPLTLRREVSETPEKFGYNFAHILEAVWPLLV